MKDKVGRELYSNDIAYCEFPNGEWMYGFIVGFQNVYGEHKAQVCAISNRYRYCWAYSAKIYKCNSVSTKL